MTSLQPQLSKLIARVELLIDKHARNATHSTRSMPTRFTPAKRNTKVSQTFTMRVTLWSRKILYLNLKTFFFSYFSGERSARCVGAAHPHHQRRVFPSANNIDIKMKCFSLSFHTDTGKKVLPSAPFYERSWMENWWLFLQIEPRKISRLSFMMSVGWNFSNRRRGIFQWPNELFTHEASSQQCCIIGKFFLLI